MNENPLGGVWLGFLIIVASGVMVLGIQVYRQVQINTTTHDVLCAIRTQQTKNHTREKIAYKRSIAFLAKHPRGIPGVPLKLIKQGQADQKQSLIDQKRQLAALAMLDC